MADKKSKNIFSTPNYLKLISLFFLIIVLISVFLFGHFCFKFLEETKFFNIAYIKVINRSLLGEASTKYFYDLIGPNVNIFEINLKQLKQKIESDFPYLDRVTVIKGFPDYLIFNLRERCFLAQISLGKNRYFDIDFNGFVLPRYHSGLNPNLPLILGLNKEQSLLIPNQKSRSKQLHYALSFIKEYKRSGWLSGERLIALDVSDNYSLSLFLEKNLEIRILRAEIKNKIKVLEGLLSEIRLNNPEVKIIDLRFKDVIINPKND